MSALNPVAAVSTEKLWFWGRTALLSALVLGVMLTLAVAALGQVEMVWTLPLLIIVVAGILWLFRRPAQNLLVVIIGFVIVANNEAGFQVREIVYALYLYTVLALWYANRLLVTKETFLQKSSDQALWLFLILLPFTLFLTVLFNGSLVGAVSELFSLSLLALYFPLKETAARYRWAPRALVITVISVGLLVSMRNLYDYWLMLGRVTQTWQVETGRVSTNDNLLMVSSLFSLTVLVYAKNKATFFASALSFFLCFGGLILTQSRGYWMAFFLGAAALFFLSDRRHRTYMLLWSSIGVVVMITVGYIVAGPFMNILLEGLVTRLLSIGSAASADLSLINRFREAATVVEHIKVNPVLGYGMGVSYYFYDIAHQLTDYDALVHNGYVGLWYKFGLWGLGLMLFFWGNTLVQGLRAFLIPTSAYWTRLCGLAASISLIGFVLSTLTSNPFFLKDSLFIFSVVAGLAGGAYLRSQRELESVRT